MGLDGFISAAEQLTGKKNSKKDQAQQQQQDESSTQTTTDWADAGSAVKSAYENFQADKAQGKGPDYAEIGGAAKKALSACNRQGCGEGEGKDEGELGREVVSGLCEGQAKKDAEEGVEGCKVKVGEGVRGTRGGLRSEKTGALGGEAELAAGEKYGAEVSQGGGLGGSLGERGDGTAADEEGSGTLGRGGYSEADVSGEKTDSGELNVPDSFGGPAGPAYTETGLADAAQRAGVSRDEAEAIGSFVESGRRNLTSRRGE